jgi:hypothetical protein
MKPGIVGAPKRDGDFAMLLSPPFAFFVFFRGYFGLLCGHSRRFPLFQSFGQADSIRRNKCTW